MSFVDDYFQTSGKTNADIDQMVDEIFALPQANPHFVRGQKIFELINELEQQYIGPGATTPEMITAERALITDEREKLGRQAMKWSLSTVMDKDELKQWLKTYFAVRQYAIEKHLGTEFIRGPKKPEPN